MRINVFILFLLLNVWGVSFVEAKEDFVSYILKTDSGNHYTALTSITDKEARFFHDTLRVRLDRMHDTARYEMSNNVRPDKEKYLGKVAAAIKEAVHDQKQNPIKPSLLHKVINNTYPYRQEIIDKIGKIYGWNKLWNLYSDSLHISKVDIVKDTVDAILENPTGFGEIKGAARNFLEMAIRADAAERLYKTLYSGAWEGDEFYLYDVEVRVFLFKRNGHEWDGDEEEREHRIYHKPDLALGLRSSSVNFDYEYFPVKFNSDDKNEDRYKRWLERACLFKTCNQLSYKFHKIAIRGNVIDVALRDIDYMPSPGRAEEIGTEKNFDMNAHLDPYYSTDEYNGLVKCNMKNAVVRFYKRRTAINSKNFKVFFEQQNSQPSALGVILEQDSSTAGTLSDPGSSKPVQINW
ncbi:hypothetical protein [Desulfovibrio sp. JC022]|uniref:hypothetical protein n=1 Tax=Desulfovibrio sp. JC022 TaxID=2593642 RepID=UPI0013D5C34B|nr:hypothetical protein [Desulfovibrio sp. JC022]NDV22607.1 hypothetical protein [Desulfovibrio sp. JC022]